MATFTLPEVRTVGLRVSRDVSHRLALTVSARPGSWALAVAEANSGEVLAWDGWYNDTLTEDERRPITTLDWQDWDDMPSKLLLPFNAVWLGGHLAYWLMPEYSIARSAGRLVSSHAKSRDFDETPSQFSQAALVAYFPILDEAVFEAASR